MSLINQVLNELESRGATVPLGEETIRAVPPRRQSHAKRNAILAVVLLLVMLAAFVWFMGHTDHSVAKQTAVVARPLPVVAIEPTSAVVANASAPVAAIDASGQAQLSGSIHGKPLLEVQTDAPTVDAPKSQKSPPRRHHRKAEQQVGNSEDVAAENPEIAQLKTVSPMQRAESEFQKANLALKEGRTNDALAGYESALLIDSSHKAARRAWVGLLINLKRNDDAERVLKKGIRRDPHDASFSMLLARLQVERGDIPLALETLQKTLPYAETQPDYQAFLAALLQRQDQHEEAIAHYQVALKLVPNNGIWLMGLGISLQALQRNDDARSAYQRALSSNSLNPQLQAYVQQKLKAL